MNRATRFALSTSIITSILHKNPLIHRAKSPICPPSFSLCPVSRPYCSVSAGDGGLLRQTNPLLQDFELFPPFDAIEAKHVRPGIRAILAKLESDLDELEKTAEPSWPKLVEPLERIVDKLTVAWGIVNHLKSERFA